MKNYNLNPLSLQRDEYTFVLQRQRGGRDIIVIDSNFTCYKRPIDSYNDEPLEPQDEVKISTHSLCFLDTLTNGFTGLNELIKCYDLNKDGIKYNSKTSHLTVIDRNKEYSLPLSFGDKRLLKIASETSGNRVCKKSSEVVDEIIEMIYLIENPDMKFSDFINKKSKQKYGPIPFVKNVLVYANCCKEIEKYGHVSTYIPDYLLNSYNWARQIFISRIFDYENFRTLYLLKKNYLLELDKNKKSQNIKQKIK